MTQIEQPVSPPRFLNRIFQTASFRLTLWTALLSSVAIIIVGLLVLLAIKSTFTSQLRNQIHDEMAQLYGDYLDDGIEELKHDIEERVKRRGSNRLLYFIKNPKGEVTFDSMADHPEQAGWHNIANGETGVDGISNGDVLLLVVPLKKGCLLGVGAEMASVKNATRLITRIFLLSLLLMVPLLLITGYVVSRQVLKRIDVVREFTTQIASNPELMDMRLPQTGTRDELDKLSATINQMLNQIGQLMGSVRRISSNLAHDLRTPLGHLRQRLETVVSSFPEDSEEHRSLNRVVMEVDEMLSTFAAILRISEIESGTGTQGFQELDLNFLLNELAEIYAPLAEDQQKQIVLNNVTQVSVMGDRQMLRQLFVNLFENALRYATDGVAITITIERISQDKARLLFVDNGAGVPEESLVHIFEPFYQVDASRNCGGAGLGLNLVKVIAKRHNFALTAFDNHPGLGFEFVFDAPSVV